MTRKAEEIKEFSKPFICFSLSSLFLYVCVLFFSSSSSFASFLLLLLLLLLHIIALLLCLWMSYSFCFYVFACGVHIMLKYMQTKSTWAQITYPDSFCVCVCVYMYADLLVWTILNKNKRKENKEEKSVSYGELNTYLKYLSIFKSDLNLALNVAHHFSLRYMWYILCVDVLSFANLIHSTTVLGGGGGEEYECVLKKICLKNKNSKAVAEKSTKQKIKRIFNCIRAQNTSITNRLRWKIIENRND